MKKSGLAFFAMIFLLISNYSFGQGVDIDLAWRFKKRILNNSNWVKPFYSFFVYMYERAKK